MHLGQHKKGATQLRGLKFIFALFGIAFMFLMFYIWVQKNITAQSRSQAEIVSSEIELHIMFSDFIKTHGIDIASKTPNEIETILQKCAEKQILIDKGGYSADCSQSGNDKECELTITLHETLGAVLSWSLFASFILPSPLAVTGILVLIKLIVDRDIKDAEQEAYLPTPTKQAMKFKLRTLVEFA